MTQLNWHESECRWMFLISHSLTVYFGGWKEQIWDEGARVRWSILPVPEGRWGAAWWLQEQRLGGGWADSATTLLSIAIPFGGLSGCRHTGRVAEMGIEALPPQINNITAYNGETGECDINREQRVGQKRKEQRVIWKKKQLRLQKRAELIREEIKDGNSWDKLLCQTSPSFKLSVFGDASYSQLNVSAASPLVLLSCLL